MAVTFLADLDQILNSQEEPGAQVVFESRWMWVLAGGEAGPEVPLSRGATLGPSGAPEGKKALCTSPREKRRTWCACPSASVWFVRTQGIYSRAEKEG